MKKNSVLEFFSSQVIISKEIISQSFFIAKKWFFFSKLQLVKFQIHQRQLNCFYLISDFFIETPNFSHK